MKVLNIFSNIFIAQEVKSELKKHKIIIPKKIRVLDLDPKSKEVAELLMNAYFLDLGEAQAIALALQEKSDYFLTDDLDARTVANNLNLEVHGSVGIILRAFREKMIDKNTAIEKVKELHDKSSLFITRNLVDEVVRAIEGFGKRG